MAGYPHISYWANTNHDLKYAYRDDAGWHIEIADAVGEQGRYTSLALDGYGNPHISYCDETNHDLRYARREDAGWQTETVDAVGSVGTHTSLALDALGHPHISYHDETNYDLKYAYEDTSGWHIQTVDAVGSVGGYTSLTLDSSGKPHISYYDFANRDLKYARMVGPQTFQLNGVLAGGAVQLTWNAVTGTQDYWVYGASDLPWFLPGAAPGYEYRLTVLPSGTASWSSSNGVGNPNINWTYLVMAVDATEQEIARSNRVGEADFEADIP